MREVKLNAREHERFLKVMEQKLSDRGMDIEELAEQIGVARQSLYNFRTDTSRNPSRFTAAKIATFLDMKPGDWRG